LSPNPRAVASSARARSVGAKAEMGRVALGEQSPRATRHNFPPGKGGDVVSEHLQGRQQPDVPQRLLGDRLTTRPRRGVGSGTALVPEPGPSAQYPTARVSTNDPGRLK
jgi:hypothetical protein